MRSDGSGRPELALPGVHVRQVPWVLLDWNEATGPGLVPALVPLRRPGPGALMLNRNETIVWRRLALLEDRVKSLEYRLGDVENRVVEVLGRQRARLKEDADARTRLAP